MTTLEERLCDIYVKLSQVVDLVEKRMNEKQDIKQEVIEGIEEALSSEDEYAPFNRLNDNIRKLTEANQEEDKLELATKYCDKFEDYMKNIDKLNLLVNEFKGLVAIVRGDLKKDTKK